VLENGSYRIRNESKYRSGRGAGLLVVRAQGGVGRGVQAKKYQNPV